jgi:hypothetical protein
MIGSDAGARQPRLDAARVPAIAFAPGSFVVARPGQRIVSPLSRDRVRAIERAAMHDDAGTDASAEDDAEHDVGAATRTIGRFGKRKAIRVVGDAHVAPEKCREVLTQRTAVQRHGIGSAQQPRDARNGTRRPYAHRRHVRRQSEFELDFAHQPRHRRKRRVVAGDRRGHAATQALAPLPVERDDFDLGSAQVQPQADGLRHGCPPFRPHVAGTG